jgi:poly(3-hydroxybutyrate) depolymerase
MTKIILLAGLLTILSACNGKSPSHTTNQDQPSSTTILPKDRFELDGHFYTLKFPKDGLKEGKAYKLLFVFHGSGGTDTKMQRVLRLEELSDDYIVVYPKSKEEEWDEGCECNIAYRLGAKDVQFITNLIEKLHQDYNLLAGENYVVGFSQGGLFSQNMLCKHSELIRAAATVAAPMSVQLYESCRISHPSNYILVQGTYDAVLPYNGRESGVFALKSAEAAIKLFARQNLKEPEIVSETTSNGVTELVFSDNSGIVNKLVTIHGGNHTWSFKGYKTSEKLIEFFNQSSAFQLPESSSLYSLGSGNYHVRTLGQKNEKGDVVILSGANKFFHSDSAWASLVQPLLAEHARVHVIDRLGNAWSSNIEEPSFKQLAEDLPELLGLLGSQKVTFLSFANSNLATLMYLNHPNPEIEVKGMVWADPDILLPHSIMQYQSGAVAGLRKYKNEYIEHVSEGNWTEKSVERIAIERAEVAELIPSSHQDKMDWVYYDKVTEQRLDVAKQVIRIKEMMNYHDDLNLAEPLQYNINVPISVIDSDFERLDIANATEEEKPSLIKWQQEGTQWSKEIANKTQGKYYELKNASHQVFFEHPDAVVKATLEVLERND